jgi:hypothetical protein
VSAATIAAALGNARREGRNWRCFCPVHGGRSLALRDGRRGLLVKCWAGCETHDVLAELRRRSLIAGCSDGARLAPAVTHRNDRADAERRAAMAARIWDAAKDARGCPMVQYFAGGITLSPPASLRWAPALRRLDGSCGPAIVARVDSVHGELVGVHRTWLDRDPDGTWRRRDRASLGPVAGGAVRLGQVGETLMVGEGVETCLAVIQATGQPAWAALSTSGMMALRLLPEVRQVVILADHDTNGAGELAARAAARRWLVEGRRVRIAAPPEPGTDFNDVLFGGVGKPGARDVAA